MEERKSEVIGEQKEGGSEAVLYSICTVCGGCGKGATREGRGGGREVFMKGKAGRRDVEVRIFLGAWVGGI